MFEIRRSSSKRTRCLALYIGCNFLCAIDQAAVAQENENVNAGTLLGSFPSADEVYNAETGDVLLFPGLPLDPPPLKSDASRMGFIDSGVMQDHPQLKGLVIAQKDFAGDDPVDRIGHGTIVALIALGSSAELRRTLDEDQNRFQEKPTSTFAIVSAKVTAASGQIKKESVIQAIHWVVSKGAKVVNISLGFTGDYGEYEDLCATIQSYSTQPHGGVMFVAAAGNFGPDVAVYPAACGVSNILAVAEARDGAIVASSGRGDIAAETGVSLIPKWAYYLEEGKALALQGEWEAASRSLQLSLQEEGQAVTFFHLGLISQNQNNLEAAYGFFYNAQQLDLNAAVFPTYMGVVRFLQRRFYDAEELIRTALELESDSQFARFNLGRIMLETGRFSEALKTFEQIKTDAPDYPDIDEAISVTHRIMVDNERQ